MQQPVADSQVNIFKKTPKWEELAPVPVCHNGHTAVLLGGNIYVVGSTEGGSLNDCTDSYRLDIYNLTTNQWSPSPIISPYRWFAMAVLLNKLVIAGGASKNKEVVKKILVLNGGQWKYFSEMPTARFYATAIGYHSMLIVVGGQAQMKRLSTTELFDTTNGCWYTCNDLPSPHQQLKATIVNDMLYLLGGVDEDFKSSPQVFCASLGSLSTHQLNFQAAPSTPWRCSAPAFLFDRFVLTVGGKQPSDYMNFASGVYTLNPSIGQWQHLTDIPSARSFSAVVSVSSNEIIVIGGMTNNDTQFSNSVWIGVFE